MSTNSDDSNGIPFSTNEEVVGAAPAVSVGNYMLAISSGLSRASIDSANQQQINNMTSLLVAVRGVGSLLALGGEKQEFGELIELVQQLTSGE